MSEFNYPPLVQVLVPGDLVETMEGRYAMVVGRGWDEEGGFGYFVQVEKGFDRVWIYHAVVQAAVVRVWRKPTEASV